MFLYHKVSNVKEQQTTSSSLPERATDDVA